jgi:hypothetical protein
MRKRRENKETVVARKLSQAKRKYKDHKYLDNILRRIKWDAEYHEIKIKYQNRIACGYCGMPASGIDHFVPLSQVEKYIEACKRQGKSPVLFKISCCAECNRLLGSSTFSTFEIRLEHLRKRLKRKYANSNKNDKLLQGRLKRRLSFDRGLKRVNGTKLKNVITP